MSIATVRGGVPVVKRVDATAGVAPAGGVKVKFPFYINFLKVRVASNDCHMYFTEEDYLADVNYCLIKEPGGGNYPYGQWEGPVETCAGREGIWFRGVGGTSIVEAVGFQRRG